MDKGDSAKKGLNTQVGEWWCRSSLGCLGEFSTAVMTTFQNILKKKPHATHRLIISSSPKCLHFLQDIQFGVCETL